MLFYRLALWVLLLPSQTFARDLYKILGINENLDDAKNIKQAYRMKVKEYHPDVNPSKGASEKFAEVAEAYEILSDPELKEVYDKGGEDAVRIHKSQLEMEPFDPFSAFFGGRPRDYGPEKSPPIKLPLRVALRTLYTGDTINASFSRPVVCVRADDCVEKRKNCSRKGAASYRTKMNGLIFSQDVEDPSCVAKGKGLKDGCKGCPDGMTEFQDTTLEILIEPGSSYDSPLAFDGMGMHNYGETPGDLYIFLFPYQNERFSRHGHNLRYRHRITLMEALTGFTHSIVHVDEVSEVIISRGEITPPGFVITLERKGMPKQRQAGFGNLDVLIEVSFPHSLTTSQRSKVNEALSGVTTHINPIDYCNFFS